MAQSIDVSLLGPPEIHRPSPSATTCTAAKTDPFVDLMVKKFNTAVELRGFTENGAPTFLSTGNPCLDFFFHVVPDTPPESLIQRLEIAWEHDPLKTLKLICNLRGVRGTGKSDKEGGYTAALWLHQNHPKTLACNVASFAGFGYSKDLLEILFRLLEGSDARELAKNAYEEWKQIPQKKEMKKKLGKKGYEEWKQKLRMREGMMKRFGKSVSSKNQRKPVKLQKKTTGPKLSREERRIARARNVVERFNRDPDFKFLHDRISDYFALCLRSDMKMLDTKDSKKISLAAKWCPSLDSSYDQITLLCESVARKVFPRDECPEYEGVEEAHYAYRVRDRLRKQVLVPLRRALELPEVYMGANDWGSIPYNRVASVAMKTYTNKFYEHDGERFVEYLEQVREGKVKIAAGALLPHEIIASLCDYNVEGVASLRDYNVEGVASLCDYNNVEGVASLFDYNGEEMASLCDYSGEEVASLCDYNGEEVAELQWKRMVDDMAKKGKLNNCLAICDVSGSMHGTPMEVSVALGILVSELSEEPWKGKLITFSENPELQKVQGSSLKEKTEFVRKMEWGMNTDFQKVFDTILQVAVDGKLKPDEMIKRLFVFSDMEFDQAREKERIYSYTDSEHSDSSNSDGVLSFKDYESENEWETDYEEILRKFREHGYGDCVPEIVFWNLRDSRATPVPSKQTGVALVSGFSKNLISLFLEGGWILDPEAVMDAAISGEEYKKLVVMD